MKPPSVAYLYQVSAEHGEDAARQMRSHERIAEQIGEQIRDGRLVRGQKLPTEREMSERFGVGRGVVREAVRMLDAMGLVESRQGSGIYVRNNPIPSISRALTFSVTPEEQSVASLFEFRMVLEVAATEQAALRRTDAQLAVIERAAAATTEATPDFTGDEWHQADQAFHHAISDASGNPYMAVTIDAVRQMQRDVTRLVREMRGSAGAAEQHRAIAEAIAARSPRAGGSRDAGTYSVHRRSMAASAEDGARSRRGIGRNRTEWRVATCVWDPRWYMGTIAHQEVVHGIPRDQPTAIPPALGGGCRRRCGHRVWRWHIGANADEVCRKRQHDGEHPGGCRSEPDLCRACPDARGLECHIHTRRPGCRTGEIQGIARARRSWSRRVSCPRSSSACRRIRVSSSRAAMLGSMVACGIGSISGLSDRVGPTKLNEQMPITWDAPDANTIRLTANWVEKWDQNADASEYTFYIRKGLKWSDGTEVTTDDTKFWWDDIALNKDISPTADVFDPPARRRRLQGRDADGGGSSTRSKSSTCSRIPSCQSSWRSRTAWAWGRSPSSRRPSTSSNSTRSMRRRTQ